MQGLQELQVEEEEAHCVCIVRALGHGLVPLCTNADFFFEKKIKKIGDNLSTFVSVPGNSFVTRLCPLSLLRPG